MHSVFGFFKKVTKPVEVKNEEEEEEVKEE